jgi:hypothetical protein
MTAAVDGMSGERVLMVAEKTDPVVCEKGMRVLADTTYEDAPPLDVVLIPGGSGARDEIDNPATVAWLTRTVAECSWVTSVCMANSKLGQKFWSNAYAYGLLRHTSAPTSGRISCLARETSKPKISAAIEDLWNHA